MLHLTILQAITQNMLVESVYISPLSSVCSIHPSSFLLSSPPSSLPSSFSLLFLFLFSSFPPPLSYSLLSATFDVPRDMLDDCLTHREGTGFVPRFVSFSFMKFHIFRFLSLSLSLPLFLSFPHLSPILARQKGAQNSLFWGLVDK